MVVASVRARKLALTHGAQALDRRRGGGVRRARAGVDDLRRRRRVAGAASSQQRQAPADAADEQHGLAHGRRLRPRRRARRSTRNYGDIDPFGSWKQRPARQLPAAQARLPRRACSASSCCSAWPSSGTTTGWRSRSASGSSSSRRSSPVTTSSRSSRIALLWPYLKWSGWALALVSYLSCQIPLALLGWDDERYVAISIVYILFVLAVTAALARV